MVEIGFLLPLFYNFTTTTLVYSTIANTFPGIYNGYIKQYGRRTMKRLLIALALVAVLFMFTTSTVSAGGDKVRGDNGQGGVNQVQIQDPPPFQP
jgi:hypothetical protein